MELSFPLSSSIATRSEPFWIVAVRVPVVGGAEVNGHVILIVTGGVLEAGWLTRITESDESAGL